MGNINDVKNNKEKGLTYKKINELYKLAIDNKFYYEALLIDYAMLEDRLESILCHLGLVTIEQDEIFIKCDYKNDVFDLLNKNRDHNVKVNFENISHKYRFIKYLISEYIKNGLDYYPSLKITGNKLDRLDLKLLIKLIAKLDIWVKSRNKIVHGLMKRNYMDVENNISDLAEEGFCYFRELDSYVRKIRK